MISIGERQKNILVLFNKLRFGPAEDLVHEVVLGMKVFGTATLDLGHGLVVIPELDFDARLEEGGVGGSFAFQDKTLAESGALGKAVWRYLLFCPRFGETIP